MTDQPTSSEPSLTPEEFFADRARFWHSWTRVVFGCAIFLTVLLIAMEIFLV